jgi:hypothetical protein
MKKILYHTAEALTLVGILALAVVALVTLN